MPAGGDASPPSGPLARAIDRDFGSFEGLKEQLKTAGISQFGSGWVWLLTDKNGGFRRWDMGYEGGGAPCGIYRMRHRSLLTVRLCACLPVCPYAYVRPCVTHLVR